MIVPASVTFRVAIPAVPPDLAHFAVITPPLVGHLNALQALGRTLVRRGHRVTLLGPEDARRWAWGDIGFHAIGRASHPPGHVERMSRRMGALVGPLGLPAMIAGLAFDTDMVCRDAPLALGRLGVDALIVDQMEPGGGLVARATGLPYMSVACALPVERDVDVPPVFLGWDYDPSRRGRARNRGGHRVADWIMRRHQRTIERNARRFGLPLHGGSREKYGRVADWISPTLSVSQTIPSLDFPRATTPANFHPVGPLRVHDPRVFRPAGPDGRAWRRDGRPLVFASLGTLQGARERLFRAIAGAARDLDVQLVMVHCGRLTPAQVRRLPGHGAPDGPYVTDFVPQGAVLDMADAAVLHGGFNTVLDAAARAVPMVVMPLAFEQPAIATRLQRAGVARKLSAWTTGHGGGRHDNLAHEIDRVMHDAAMRPRLDAVRAEIAAAGGAERAADLAEERLLGISRRNVTRLPTSGRARDERGVA